jgi:hypothetical protein
MVKESLLYFLTLTLTLTLFDWGCNFFFTEYQFFIRVATKGGKSGHPKECKLILHS